MGVERENRTITVEVLLNWRGKVYLNSGARSARTMTNIVWGTVNKLVNIFLPFVMRTVMIYVLGSEYLGLNTLFSSILQMLNLAELGLGSAIVYSMYAPMAHNDEKLVCALLALYKKLYRYIGMAVFVIGMVLMPFLPKLIKGTYPNGINLYGLYFIFLLNTVISYLFFAYKTSIWNASQRLSMINNIRTIVTVAQNILQVLLLLLLKDYYVYIAIMPVCTIANNLLVYAATKKYYPQYICRGRIPKELADSIQQRVKGLFISKFCTTTRNALDSVFISSMIGLGAVAMYGNYYYIMSSVYGITTIIITSMTASVGNSIVTESVEKNYADMKKFDFAFSWITGLCTICMLCLYQPFVRVWLGETMMYPFAMVLLFCVYFYSLCLGGVRSAYHDAAGLWWEARYRAIAETLLNIILNFIFTYLWGVAGTVLSTIVAILVINYGYGTRILFDNYFKGISMKEYYTNHLRYTVAILVVAIVTYLLCYVTPGTGIQEVFKNLVICATVPNILLVAIYRKNPLFQQNINLFTNVFRSKFKRSGLHH